MDDYEKSYGAGGWKNNSIYVSFMKACLEKKYYNLLLFINHTAISQVKSIDALSQTMHARFTDYVVKRTYVPHFCSILRTTSGAYPSLFDSVRMSNTWGIYTPRKVGTETRKAYLHNMFFIAEVDPMYVGNLDRANITPLMCLMVKKENMPLIRAHFITNLPIPANMLELWVDNSLEAEGSKLKPHFRKFVKNRLVSAGVEVKSFNSLREQIISEFSIPKFRTIDDKSHWTKEVLGSYYDIVNKAKKYKTVPSTITTDSKIEAVLDLLKKELEDVKASIK